MGKIINFADIYKRKGGVYMGDIKMSKKKEIEKKVINLLQENQLVDKQYIDIVDYVKREGFLVQSADLGKETTGCLAVNEKENVDDRGFKKLIVVNQKFDNPDKEEDVILKKSRFIIAHEYAHYILHKPAGKTLYAQRDTIHKKEPKELEADYFARSILMPAKSFLNINETLNKLQKDIGFSDKEFNKFRLDFLGTHFKVTRRKAEKRLEDIELLKSVIE